jgi:hypothetical protein
MRWFGLRQLLISSTTCTTSFDLRSTHPPDTPHYLRLAGLSLPRPSGAPQLSSPFILLSILPLCIRQLPRPRISVRPVNGREHRSLGSYTLYLFTHFYSLANDWAVASAYLYKWNLHLTHPTLSLAEIFAVSIIARSQCPIGRPHLDELFFLRSGQKIQSVVKVYAFHESSL